MIGLSESTMVVSDPHIYPSNAYSCAISIKPFSVISVVGYIVSAFYMITPDMIKFILQWLGMREYMRVTRVESYAVIRRESLLEIVVVCITKC